jgi:hypothetical protein
MNHPGRLFHRKCCGLLLIAWYFFPTRLSAADYRIESIQERPSAEGLSAEIVGQLERKGIRLIRGEKRSYAELWLCGEISVQPGFQPTGEVLYPFRPGQLIGVIRFASKGDDFREQQISTGWYTLRYGQQPVDGNHVGTSPTRDFLCLVRAADETSAELLEEKDLIERSAAAAESAHPLLLCLQRPEAEDGGRPSLHHDEQRDWWILRVLVPASDGARQFDLPTDLVVVGAAQE